ncbi:MAG: FecR domain-containing protein [Deltaproteobacteria bacterium]|nr:FecR domain-containing protein [Deltaproteobacteria bacterium]
MKKINILFIIVTVFSSHLSFAEKDAPATVVLLKGKAAKKVSDGPPVWLKVGDTIEQNAFVTTTTESSIKLLLKNKTQMSLGPNSSIQLGDDEAFLSKGVIRTKVVPKPQKIAGFKPKFVIKTRSATMGVRGTENQAGYNPQNDITTAVGFSGETLLVKTRPEDIQGLSKQELVDKVFNEKAAVITEGTFSTVNPSYEAATIPTKISPAQFESLKNTDPSEQKQTKDVKQQDMAKVSQMVRSPIPPGVDPKNFAGTGEGIKELGGLPPQGTIPGGMGGQSQPPPDGFFNKSTGAYAPPAGVYVDFKTGLFIPPPPGSTYDPIANVFVPPPFVGGIDSAGHYVPPNGYDLDPKKGFVHVDMPGGPMGGPGGPPKDLSGYGDPNRRPDMSHGPIFDQGGFGGFPPPPGDLHPGGPGGPYPGGSPPPGGYLPPPGGYFGDPYNPNNPPPGGYQQPPPPPPGSTTNINFKITIQ